MNIPMFKYRGKRLDGGGWIEGDKVESPEGVFIKEKGQYVLFDEPEYHSQGMGCGLEDRCITDRYAAMEHGWNSAVDQCAERHPVFIQIDPATLGVSWGMKDKNGREVFTKQPAVCYLCELKFEGQFEFVNNKFVFISKKKGPLIFSSDTIEIIGEE